MLATGLVLGLVFGQEWVAAVFAVVLFLGAAFGPRYGPVLRFYATVIKPRLWPLPSELEDPRPPRFSAWVGTVFLTAATVAFVAGAAVVGWVLVGIVAALAALSAITGLCVGCEMYVWLVRLRGGVRVTTVDRVGHDGPAKVAAAHDAGFARLHCPMPCAATARSGSCSAPSTARCARRWSPRSRAADPVSGWSSSTWPSTSIWRRSTRCVVLPRCCGPMATGAVVARLAGVDAVRAELAAAGAGV